MKHTNDGKCERCEMMLEKADEQIFFWFYRIKEYFPTVHASCIFRSKEEQDLQVKEKKSLLKWPHSKHNTFKDGKPCSQAMDLFSLNDDGKAEFRMGFYVQIANFLDDQSAPIEWGGHWKFVDGPHFQVKD